jgi:hypothetical protein
MLVVALDQAYSRKIAFSHPELPPAIINRQTREVPIAAPSTRSETKAASNPRLLKFLIDFFIEATSAKRLAFRRYRLSFNYTFMN